MAEAAPNGTPTKIMVRFMNREMRKRASRPTDGPTRNLRWVRAPRLGRTLMIRRWGTPSEVIGDKLRFRKGDIIFGRRRAYQRKLAVAEFDGICSAHAMVVQRRPNRRCRISHHSSCSSDLFMQPGDRHFVGSLSPTINWKTLRIQEFPLPPQRPAAPRRRHYLGGGRSH